MPELPASVRVALWVTHAWSVGSSPARAVERALPDVDHTEGLVEQVGLWHDLGEGALLVALPGPGDLAGLPRCGPVAADAATVAGEALYVAGIGGMLVPTVSTYGSAGARGLRIDWMAHDADPVPPHRVEALELSQLERHLRRQLLESVTELDEIGGTPWSDDLSRDLVDERLGTDWALPDALPDRARRVIGLAGTVAVATELGLQASGAVTAAHDNARSAALRRLARECERTLADATNATCAQLAGWVPSR
jgi:hypothetical protein